MAHKFLIADDSQTIQKVIKITLESENYQLVECLTEESLIEQVKSTGPDVILLDFNLSENKTGYDLINELRAVKSDLRFLVMFGTFDTIDEGLLEQVGASRYIIKPFDGNQFINHCRELVEDLEVSSDDIVEEVADEFVQSVPEVIETETEPEKVEEFNPEEWVVKQPEPEAAEPVEEEGEEVENILAESLKEWGQGLESPELPPVIENESKLVEDEDSTTEIEIPQEFLQQNNEIEEEEESDFPPIMDEEQSLPAEEDLEYPDMDSLQEISVSEGGNTTDEDIDLLEQQIDEDIPEVIAPIEVDEIEEIKPYTLEEVKEEDSSTSNFEPHEIDFEPIQGPEDFPEEVVAQEPEVNSVSTEISEEKLEKIVRKVLEELLEQKFKSEIKNVAWEVVPDLAENLISKELKEIKAELLSNKE